MKEIPSHLWQSGALPVFSHPLEPRHRLLVASESALDLLASKRMLGFSCCVGRVHYKGTQGGDCDCTQNAHKTDLARPRILSELPFVDGMSASMSLLSNGWQRTAKLSETKGEGVMSLVARSKVHRGTIPSAYHGFVLGTA